MLTIQFVNAVCSLMRCGARFRCGEFISVVLQWGLAFIELAGLVYSLRRVADEKSSIQSLDS